MLRSMQLENFKAFGQRTIIPLAPITLIFGQNSSGKSSILQSLNLLKQTRESRDADALLQPRTENGFVDLGGFQEMLFDHDLNRTLGIRLEMSLPKRHERLPLFRGHSKLNRIAIDLQFVRRTLEEEVSLCRFSLHEGDLEIAAFEPTDVSEDFGRFGSQFLRFERRRIASSVKAMRCVSITDDIDFWVETVALAVKHRDKLHKGLQEVRTSLSNRKTRHSADLFDEEKPESREIIFKTLDEAIRLFADVPSKSDVLDWFRREQLRSVIGMDGFLPVFMAMTDEFPPVDFLLSRYSRRAAMPPEWFPNISRLAMVAGATVERTLASLFPLGPFRKPAARLYIFTGTTPQDVGFQGHLLPDFLFRHPELVATANEWLKKLDIGYELQICPLGPQMSDLFEVRLVDTRRDKKVLVGLSDVGFGISQILPLVVQSLAGTGQTITIEQPEVHIHPRLQADLGDLLIEAIKEPRRNQFIIETHSEHLALRLQRRVREKKLSPDQISIVYVSRGPNGATVQPLRLDDEGDFMDDFPGGFFPERLRELR
jgi:hypothetical protein